MTKIYPHWMYHPVYEPRVVEDAGVEEELAKDGWVDSPAHFVKAAVEGVGEEVTHVAVAVHKKVADELDTLKQDYAEFFQKVKNCAVIKDVKALIDEYETE